MALAAGAETVLALRDLEPGLLPDGEASPVRVVPLRILELPQNAETELRHQPLERLDVGSDVVVADVLRAVVMEIGPEEQPAANRRVGGDLLQDERPLGSMIQHLPQCCS